MDAPSPSFLFGAAYYPEHRDPARWAFDLDAMAAAGVNTVRAGEFAWVRFEPRPGDYDFDWLDRFLALARARGIGLLLCPPLRTAPAWLVARDPDMLIVRADGVRLEFGSRYTFCILHPLLRERGLELARRLARRYGPDPGVLGWHLDNEYGDEPDCHCPRCAEAWRAWLKDRYGTAAALNEAWGTIFWGLEFDRFEQVPTPRVTKAQPHPALLQAWRQFRSDATVAMVALHAAAVREHAGPRQFVTTNNQALWNNRTDYYAMAPHLDVAGTNYYPPYGPDARASALGLAACRSYKRRPFQIHELRSGPQAIPGCSNTTPAPGEVVRTALHAVANGADALYFFRWRICPFGPEQHWGAITDYDGRPTRVYEEVKTLGQGLRRLAPALRNTAVASDVAILYDFPNRWLAETGVALNVDPSFLMERTKMLYRVARGLGLNVDAVGGAGPFDGYKLLIAPVLPLVDHALAARLRDYVAGGGLLLWHPWSGMKDRDARVYPGRLHPELEKVFGLRLADFLPLGAARPQAAHPDMPEPAGAQACALRWGGRDYAAGAWVDFVEARGAQPEGAFAGTWYAGRPALLRQAFGAGQALYLATFPEERFYPDLLAALCRERGVSPILPSAIPPEVEIAERRSPDGRRLVFLLNCSASPQTVALPAPMRDLWAEERLEGRAPLPPHGVRVLVRDAPARPRQGRSPGGRKAAGKRQGAGAAAAGKDRGYGAGSPGM